jgi:hypothetical protein
MNLNFYSNKQYKVMNKEQQELLDEIYKNYVKWWEKSDDSCNLTEEQSNKWLKLIDGGLQWAPFSQEEFINKCKTDNEFSEKCGLKIEERELSLEERFNIRYPGGRFSIFQENYPNTHRRNNPNDLLDVFNIPTKLITITYNDKTIESYE